MHIRVFDWNAWNENKKPPNDIADFIFSHNADIISLQEVSASVRDALSARAARERYQYCVARDMKQTDGTFCFLVVLSRAPITRSRVIRSNRKRGWRSFFSSLWHNIEEHLESLRVDVRAGERRIRILNVHLEVGTGPKNRIQQFLRILRRNTKRRTIRNMIIAGDLNIYGQGWYERFVGWLWFGLRSVEFFMDEREEFERIFRHRGFANMFRGETTFSTGGVAFQFDHILVPSNITVLYKKVLNDNCGSDHQPIIVDVEV